jgi:hypothetical protein
MSFLANKARPTANAQPSAPAAPAARAVGRYAALRSSDEKAPRLLKGNYVVEIVENKTIETFEKGRLWICEVVVLEAEHGSANMPGPASMMGSRRSGKAEKVTFPRVKRLCVTATGHETDAAFEAEFQADPETHEGGWEDLFDRVLGEPLVETFFGVNPLAGRKIRVMATESSNRDESGNPYTNYAFSPYSE